MKKATITVQVAGALMVELVYQTQHSCLTTSATKLVRDRKTDVINLFLHARVDQREADDVRSGSSASFETPKPHAMLETQIDYQNGCAWVTAPEVVRRL